EYFARVKELGKQRSAMLTCMTCADTASRWGTWEDDPRRALEREISWECGWRRDRGTKLRDELEAIAMLLETHRDEFLSLVKNIENRRAWNERKAAHAARKPLPGTVL